MSSSCVYNLESTRNKEKRLNEEVCPNFETMWIVRCMCIVYLENTWYQNALWEKASGGGVMLLYWETFCFAIHVAVTLASIPYPNHCCRPCAPFPGTEAVSATTRLRY